MQVIFIKLHESSLYKAKRLSKDTWGWQEAENDRLLLSVLRPSKHACISGTVHSVIEIKKQQLTCHKKRNITRYISKQSFTEISLINPNKSVH